MIRFDYGQLRERLRDANCSQAELANALGLSRRSVSLKMNGKVMWRDAEIFAVMKTLGIPMDRVGQYFFTPKVQFCEQQAETERQG